MREGGMDVVKRVKIVIPVIPESQNVVLRMNRYERHRALQEKAALIKWYCKERPDKPFQKAHVLIKYYFPDRCRRDPDNYTGGGAKGLIDGLVQIGIIEDDSFGHIRLTVDGDVDPNEPRTEIEVTEID